VHNTKDTWQSSLLVRAVEKLAKEARMLNRRSEVKGIPC
jgi:hypothetical protein